MLFLLGILDFVSIPMHSESALLTDKWFHCPWEFSLKTFKALSSCTTCWAGWGGGRRGEGHMRIRWKGTESEFRSRPGWKLEQALQLQKTSQLQTEGGRLREFCDYHSQCCTPWRHLIINRNHQLIIFCFWPVSSWKEKRPCRPSRIAVHLIGWWNWIIRESERKLASRPFIIVCSILCFLLSGTLPETSSDIHGLRHITVGKEFVMTKAVCLPQRGFFVHL